jgi:acyl transferase domain-containing protein
VIHGRRAAVQKVVQRLAAEGVKGKSLPGAPCISLAADGADPGGVCRRCARSVLYHPVLRLSSNVTGQLAGDEVMTPEYWVRHIPRDRAVCCRRGHPARHKASKFFWNRSQTGVAGHGGEALEASRPLPALLPSLRPGVPEEKQLMRHWVRCMCAALPSTGKQFTPAASRQRILLPTYPFQRQRCWYEAVEPTSRATAGASR